MTCHGSGVICDIETGVKVLMLVLQAYSTLLLGGSRKGSEQNRNLYMSLYIQALMHRLFIHKGMRTHAQVYNTDIDLGLESRSRPILCIGYIYIHIHT